MDSSDLGGPRNRPNSTFDQAIELTGLEASMVIAREFGGRTQPRPYCSRATRSVPDKQNVIGTDHEIVVELTNTF